MSEIRFQISIILIFLIIQMAGAQQLSLDYKVSSIGPVMQVITNTGHFGGGRTNYTGPYDNEFPVGKSITYGPFALWMGGIQAGKKKVTTGGPWYGHYDNYMELYPTAAPWDTVWVVDRDRQADIPFWPNYVGISDQDLVCHFTDEDRTVPLHDPLNIDIVQTTFAWTSLEFLVHQFWITTQKEDIHDIYFGIFGNAGIGKFPNINGNPNDEFGAFDVQNHLGIEQDKAGGNDDPLGPIGFRIFADIPDSQLKWTWIDGTKEEYNVQEPPNTDEMRYDYMKAGVFHDAVQDRSYGHYLYACGPFQLLVGDTLHFTLGEILGIGMDGMYNNLARLQKLQDQSYHIPAPPPMPPLKVTTANHQVTLNWNVLAGETDPEKYTDQYRGDGDPQPFEGYRVYKSYTGQTGPWILLAEFDRTDDNIGNNLGLAHEYADVGLLNNLEYYYTVTAFSKPDSVFGIESRESSMNANSVVIIPGTATPQTVGQVAVVPNPYRADQKYYSYKPAWEKPSVADTWLEEDRRIQFINLPSPCEITVYTLAGQYVTTLHHDNPNRGYEDWNLTSHVGQTIASDIYLYSVKDLNNGKIQVGKFVVIK
jgi:hypothetical protein